MSKFSKRQKEEPKISTAALPDIVFMLLFFFMVITKMRETEILVEQRLPKATQLQKLEQKSLVHYLYIGKPTKAEYGTEPRIQANDVLINLEDIPRIIAEKRLGMTESDAQKLTVSLKADQEIKMNILTDVKLQLREADARKVNYATVKTVED